MPYYSLEYGNLWMSAKEGTFADETINAVDAAYRRLPIKFEGMVAPQPLRYNYKKTRAAGKGLDYGNVHLDGYEPIKFFITGEVIDFAFLYQLCGACTTAGSYTHTYATSTTPVTPTIRLLQKVGTGSATRYLLYVGCKITDFVCSYTEQGGRLQGTLTIECAKQVAGQALTSEPTWLTTVPYYFNPLTAFAWTGAHTMTGYCAAWSFTYKNGQSLRLPNYMIKPDMVLAMHRTIEFSWTWVADNTEDYDHNQADPNTDLDQDIAVTLTNGVGTCVLTWLKALVEYLGEAYDYKNYYIGRKYLASLNPALTSTLTIVETNTSDKTYYEG